ncbi:MAG: TlpA disulfide reductase family protein [Planctomycetota bacterium]
MKIVKQGWKCLIIIVIVLGLFTLSGSAGEPITIDNINFGELWQGDEITKEDLQDHVVGIEFWGKWCPPCRAAMPHLAKWHNKYNSQGFILLGFHSTKTETKEEVTAFCKTNNITFNIYNGGRVSGLDFSGIPHFTLFDHTGKMIYDGHPMEADGKLAAAMKAAPDWLAGEGPYKKLKSLADKVKEHKDLGKILKTLKEKHLNPDDADEKAEAEKLAERLTRYGNRLLQKAEAKKDKEPLNCFNLYQQAATVFKGDEIGDNAEKIIKSLKEDNAFQENMNADKELAQIMDETEKLKNCNKCKAFNKRCASCQEKNPSWNTLRQRIEGLIKKYPNSPAAEKAKELLPVK